MTKVLTLDIELHEPMLATGMEGDPNAATGLDYVPGSLLRGAAIGKYSGTKDSSHAEFRRLFLDGTTRFLNAYPVVNGRRTAPCPRSLMKDKYRGHNCNLVIDHAVEQAIDDTVQWQSVCSSSPFVNFHETPAIGCRPGRTIQVHTKRNRRMGRAIENDGAVFRYESVSPRQIFRASVVCNGRDAALLTTLLSGEFCLGGSRTAGYGHVGICVQESADDLDHWFENGDSLPTEDVDGRLCITLLSDAILSDGTTGQYSTSTSTICRAIGTILGNQNIEPANCRYFVQSTIVGGFNRKWGLPLMQTAAVAMGSVIVIPSCTATASNLFELIQLGIGQRRAEGFGRVAVNWQSSASFELVDQVPDSEVSAHEDTVISPHLSIVQARIRQQRIDNAINARALQITGINIRPDCRSRLQNLRLEVMDSIQRADATTYNNASGVGLFITKLQQRRTVRDKFDKIRIRESSGGAKKLLDWLSKLLSSPTPESIVCPDLNATSDSTIELSGTDAYKFRLRVAFIVLGRLAKDSKRATYQPNGSQR